MQLLLSIGGYSRLNQKFRKWIYGTHHISIIISIFAEFCYYYFDKVVRLSLL